jgi:hypothetical protein
MAKFLRDDFKYRELLQLSYAIPERLLGLDEPRYRQAWAAASVLSTANWRENFADAASSAQDGDLGSGCGLRVDALFDGLKIDGSPVPMTGRNSATL